jgi:hypothetical protein
MTHEERAAEVVDAILQAPSSDSTSQLRAQAIRLVASALRSAVKEERRKIRAAIETLPETARGAALAAVFPTVQQAPPIRTSGWHPSDSLAPIANFNPTV